MADHTTSPPAANAVFGTAGVCLHCMVWDLINKHSPVWPDEPSKKQYDLQYIGSNLIEVVAELIAGIPDRGQRRAIIRHLTEDLQPLVSKKIAAGHAPQAKAVRRQ